MSYKLEKKLELQQKMIDTNRAEGVTIPHASRLTPRVCLSSLQVLTIQGIQHKSRRTTINTFIGARGIRPMFNITAFLVNNLAGESENTPLVWNTRSQTLQLYVIKTPKNYH
jgi:hypothetical protein